jgi:hypothetical protein
LQKAQAKADAEKLAEAKALEGGDADKFKVLADKAKELMLFAETVQGMQSEKGTAYLEWFKNQTRALSAKSYEAYNKLR